MPIALNGSGTITGISAGGLPDGCVTTADIADTAVTAAKLGTTEQGQLCKAWVNFNGTGTVAIRASYNVSSITDNGTGDYTVNFTSALADANYVPVLGATFIANSYNSVSCIVVSSSGSTSPLTKTTTALRIGIVMGVLAGASSTATAADSVEINVAIFR